MVPAAAEVFLLHAPHVVGIGAVYYPVVALQVRSRGLILYVRFHVHVLGLLAGLEPELGGGAVHHKGYRALAPAGPVNPAAPVVIAVVVRPEGKVVLARAVYAADLGGFTKIRLAYLVPARVRGCHVYVREARGQGPGHGSRAVPEGYREVELVALDVVERHRAVLYARYRERAPGDSRVRVYVLAVQLPSGDRAILYVIEIIKGDIGRGVNYPRLDYDIVLLPAVHEFRGVDLVYLQLQSAQGPARLLEVAVIPCILAPAVKAARILAFLHVAGPVAAPVGRDCDVREVRAQVHGHCLGRVAEAHGEGERIVPYHVLVLMAVVRYGERD